MQNKKQLFNLFEDIAKLNNDAWDNKPGTYSDEHEAAMVIEEMLEGFDDIPYAFDELGMSEDSKINNTATPRCMARYIVDMATASEGSSDIPDVARFDKMLDALYIIVGGMHKLGLTPHQMVEGLQVVHTANLQKTGTKDAQGKVTKPADFVAPEPLLQQILDKRPTK